MKLLITRRLPEAVLDRARAEFETTIRDSGDPLTQETAAAALAEYDVILPTLGDDFGAATFARVEKPRCRILANFGVGYNHIDAAAAKAKGIAVSNTPGTVTDATADIGVMLILMSARRAGEGERLVRAGKWEGWQPVEMLGSHVTGKTLGIVGMGRIGKAVARRCHFGFGMKVVFFNRSPVADPGMPAEQLASLEAVMAAADFTVATVPGEPSTRHLIGAKAMAAMRKTSHLVNISRGDVVEEAALIAALTEGRIAGAGLDVYEREPLVPEALKRLENVVLLPHIGTAALEVRTAMGMMALDNLVAVKQGEMPPNAV